MKSNQSSPQPELVRLRTFRLDIAGEAPKVELNQVFSPNMNFSGVNGFHNDSITPTRHTGSSPARPATPRNAASERGTPSRDQISNSNRVASSPFSENGLPFSSSQIFSAPQIPANEGNESWSSAIGRAAIGGKSGRVIERLQGDNDQLRRETKLATMKLEEEIRRSESARVALDSLRAKHENLVSAGETDRLAISRRDRRIEELKADLEAEKTRRERAEKETQETMRERDEVVANLKREVAEERELAKKSTSQYEILSNSWRNLNDGYSRQTQKIKTDVRDLSQKRMEDQQRLAQLDVVVGQLSLEGDKSRKAKERVMQEFEDYKKEKEAGIKEIRARAAKNEAANHEALKEMEKTLGEMKYVINIKKDVRGAQ